MPVDGRRARTRVGIRHACANIYCAGGKAARDCQAGATTFTGSIVDHS